MSGEEVRALMRGVVDVERPLKRALELTEGHRPNVHAIRRELELARQAVDDLAFNLPRGLG